MIIFAISCLSSTKRTDFSIESYNVVVFCFICHANLELLIGKIYVFQLFLPKNSSDFENRGNCDFLIKFVRT